MSMTPRRVATANTPKIQRNDAGLARLHGWQVGDILEASTGLTDSYSFQVKLTAIGDMSILVRRLWGDRLGREERWCRRLQTHVIRKVTAIGAKP